jgi:hypothetical protein
MKVKLIRDSKIYVAASASECMARNDGSKECNPSVTLLPLAFKIQCNRTRSVQITPPRKQKTGGTSRRYAHSPASARFPGFCVKRIRPLSLRYGFEQRIKLVIQTACRVSQVEIGNAAASGCSSKHGDGRWKRTLTSADKTTLAARKNG